MAAFVSSEGRHPTHCCRSIPQRFKGRYISGAVARRAYSRTAGRPIRTLTFDANLVRNVTVTCQSLGNYAERQLSDSATSGALPKPPDGCMQRL